MLDFDDGRISLSPAAAQATQWVFEYRPQPPFNAGSPTSAPPEITALVRGMLREQTAELEEFLAHKFADHPRVATGR